MAWAVPGCRGPQLTRLLQAHVQIQCARAHDRQELLRIEQPIPILVRLLEDGQEELTKYLNSARSQQRRLSRRSSPSRGPSCRHRSRATIQPQPIMQAQIESDNPAPGQNWKPIMQAIAKLPGSCASPVSPCVATTTACGDVLPCPRPHAPPAWAWNLGAGFVCRRLGEQPGLRQTL